MRMQASGAGRNSVTTTPQGTYYPCVLKKQAREDVCYELGNFFPNQNLGCFSLIFVPLPASGDSLENVFGDCVFWDTWVDHGKMEQHINFAESWKSQGHKIPTYPHVLISQVVLKPW